MARASTYVNQIFMNGRSGRGIHSRQCGCEKQLLQRSRRFVAHFEQGEIGPELSGESCNMGFEGLVSKSPR
jgi:hypothetical protein